MTRCMKTMSNTIFTVIRMNGDADSLASSEESRRCFGSVAIAKRVARRWTFEKNGGTVGGKQAATAYVFSGTPTNPLSILLHTYESRARKQFLAAVAEGKAA